MGWPQALVEASGIEPESGRYVDVVSARKGSILAGREPGSGRSGASKGAIMRQNTTESSRPRSGAYELQDVVETALARALLLAAEAQRWDVVVQIGSELKTRRETREQTKQGHQALAVSPRGQPGRV
jgi:hypothetical protein